MPSFSVTFMKNVTQRISSPASLSPVAWDKARAFHGHACPGLALGCRMSLAAVRALDLDDTFLTGPGAGDAASPLSPDEELVCVAETDACCVDAVQSLLGCTLGKGNLLLKLRGKTALTLYHRPTSRAVRVLWTAAVSGDESRKARMDHFLYGPEKGLYALREVPFAPPERALISASLPCSGCGEPTAEYAVRLRDGKPWCPDCFPDPARIF